MTDTLVIDPNGLNLIVPCQRAGKAQKRLVGGVSIAFAGNERSHIRAELDVLPILFVNSTPVICRLIEQVFALGNQVECAGTVFNRDDAGTTIVVCAGDYTDDMEQGGTWRVPGITLREVENAQTSSFEPDTTLVYTTHTTSPDDPTAEVATTVFNGTGGCFYTLVAATPATCPSGTVGSCPITYSPSAERVWITPALAATTLSGRPIGYLVSKGTEGGSAFTYQSSKLVVYLCRGGFDVADAVEGPIESAYQAGSFFGGVITLTFPSAIVWDVQDGDQLRIELWSRIALTPGAADPDSSWPLYRQTICYGGGTGVRFGGTLTEL